MIYDISMPYEDFVPAQSIVQDITRRCHRRELSLITQDSTKLTEENQAYLESDPMALGVTFMDLENKSFAVWLSPSFRFWDSPWAIDTLLHELTHGYANCMNHGQRFRRTLTKALYRYEHEVQPVRADWFARSLVNQYSEDPYETRQMEIEFSKKEALNAQGMVSLV
jgi:hypothetical protein